MLDDAVNYVKALRHQLEVISFLILIMCVCIYDSLSYRANMLLFIMLMYIR